MRIFNQIFITLTAIIFISCIEIFIPSDNLEKDKKIENPIELSSGDTLLQNKINQIQSPILHLYSTYDEFRQIKSTTKEIQADIDRLKQNGKLIENSIEKIYDRINQQPSFDSSSFKKLTPDKKNRFNDSIVAYVRLTNEMNRAPQSLGNTLSKESMANLNQESAARLKSIDFFLINILFQNFNQIKDTLQTLKRIQLICANLKDKVREKIKNENVLEGTMIKLRSHINLSDSINKVFINTEEQLLPFRKQIEQVLLNSNEPSSYKIQFLGSTYRIFIINSDSHKVQIHVNNKKLIPLAVVWNKLQVEKQLPLMVTNAGMYNKDGSPVGLYINNYKLIKPLDETSTPLNDNFHLYPNGVFYIDSLNKMYVEKTVHFAQNKMKTGMGVQYATQSGPMLVMNDSIHDNFNFKSQNNNIRNGIGIVQGSSNKKAIVAISDNQITFFNFALLFKYILNCNNALYFDGSISKMYSNENLKKMGDLGGNLGPILSVSKRLNDKK
jgi:uncharacterized protein YigE (DUF2233 family)